MNKEILEYLKFEQENLLHIVGDNMNEFNQGRIYAIDKMIDGIEGIFFNIEDERHTTGDIIQEVERESFKL